MAGQWTNHSGLWQARTEIKGTDGNAQENTSLLASAGNYVTGAKHRKTRNFLESAGNHVTFDKRGKNCNWW